MTQRLTLIGGGLVGASLACALEPLGLKITVLEETPLDSDQQPSFDERTIALTYGSRQIFDAIGIWQAIEMQAGPIHRIHVSNRGHAGFTRLDRQQIGTDALGYVVPTRVLGKALTRRLQQSSSIEYHCPASAMQIDIEPQANTVRVGSTIGVIDTDLVVIADGGRSSLTQGPSWEKTTRSYSEQALIGIIGVDRPHDGTAFERFTDHGPLALLPLKDERFALAWTLPEQRAQQMVDCDPTAFLSALQDTFGDRAGHFTRCEGRRVYPLSRSILTSPISGRCVAIGNSAHRVHPVAGQGFNLGLRDVAELAEQLANALRAGDDIGDTAVLRAYARTRERQTRRVSRFTDGLLQIFANEFPGLSAARNIGLNLIEICPAAKTLLLKRTVGIAGPLPRLARGLSLESA